MDVLIIVVFVLGYAAIALEHNIKIDKAASALITGVVCWAIFVLGTHVVPTHLHEAKALFDMEATGHSGISQFFEHRLLHHLSEISSILFFLLGAMTIVELVDAHEGFSVITDRIRTNSKVKLLWIVCLITFFFSAVLDNLTTSIVMISLIRKLIKDQETRWLFGGMIVISANAGGAWSPIGDVTTTMLWIKGQLPYVPQMVEHLVIPSMVALLLPLSILTMTMRGGKIERPLSTSGIEHYTNPTSTFERNLIFIMGVCGLLFVPVFKTITHLPPFMGMMFSLGVLWLTTEVIHKSKNKEQKTELSVIGVLKKIDVASVLFFLGILLAVSALQEIGHLRILSAELRNSLDNIYGINIAIGFLSAIVDNVPLVAAAQGMYDTYTTSMLAELSGPNQAFFKDFVAGGNFWLFLAYCAGVGGSALIIGSAAGVAVMGLEKINFFWYLRNITWLAVIGYIGGALTYILLYA